MDQEKHTIDAQEAELYEEPLKLKGRDVAGIILALVGLSAIAIAGYIWLTPGLSLKGRAEPDLAASQAKQQIPIAGAEHAAHSPDTSTQAAPDNQPADAVPDTLSESNPEPTSSPPIPEDVLVEPHRHEGDFQCPYCGMKSELSYAQVVVEWTVGGHRHFDSWDCALSYGLEESLRISRVRVMEHGSTPAAPDWLDAAEAWFLYGTDKKITMSMPPYVAAFTDRAAAEAAQPEWGGEVVDFAGLRTRWE